MHDMGSKKMLNIYILDILRAHSDENHRLTQADIIKYLQNEYETSCERKAVGRNITELMAYGFDIAHDDGYYLASREFEDSEIRLLIDSVYFSPHIPPNQAKALIEKLRSFMGPSFGRNLHHVMSLSSLHARHNKQYFYTLQTLDEAIGEKCKVSLKINRYGVDKQLHPIREERYIINPYQLLATNGRYYLLGNHDKYDNATHLRVDRISDCEILDEKAKPMQLVKGLEQGLDLPKYMAEHIHMCIGNCEPVTFRVPKEDIGEVFDWFGKDIDIKEDKDKSEYAIVSVRVNLNAMKYWTLQYLGMVEILSPRHLREDVLKTLHAAIDLYRE